MNFQTIKKIFISKNASTCKFTQKILEKLQGIPMEFVDLRENISSNLFSNDIQTNKDILMLDVQKGKFLKNCPGTQNYLCCGYYFINLFTNCPLDCSYCILQTYINNSFLMCYVNVEDMFNELEQLFHKSHPRKLYRIGTGELTDSLAVEPLVNLIPRLVTYFSDKNNALLELKTKTDNIESLECVKHGKRCIIAWSINPQVIIEREEHGSASLEQRLKAAIQVMEWGYRIAFHFDPIIYFSGWKEYYEDLVTKVLNTIPSKCISWISLGALRYPPELHSIIENRFPDSIHLYGEFIRGIDGKMRYHKQMRNEIFKHIGGLIRKKAPDLTLYLCMESKSVWKNSLGWAPQNNKFFANYLDREVLKKLF